MNSENPLQPLSDEGVQRKQHMLDELTGHMRRLQHQRRTQRRIATAIIAPLLCLAAWWMWSIASPTPQPPVQVTQNAPANLSSQSADPPQRFNHVQTVRTRDMPSSIIVSTRTGSQYLSDDGLLDALARLDRHAGLVRTDSRVWLTNDVTDQSLQ